MRRLIFVNILLLLCSCAHVGWVQTLDGFVGTHVSGLIGALGEPTPPPLPSWAYSGTPSPTNEYIWAERRHKQRGGYWRSFSTKEAIYDQKGKVVGYYDVPQKEYVEPYTVEVKCVIQAITNDQGIIVFTDYYTDYLGFAAVCGELFPLSAVSVFVNAKKLTRSSMSAKNQAV